jgi:hypothetical protein
MLRSGRAASHDAHIRVEAYDERLTLPYVMVQHQRDHWVEARVEKQWRREGRWRLSVYYCLGIGMQHYRVFDADPCRSVASVAERHGHRGYLRTGAL